MYQFAVFNGGKFQRWEETSPRTINVSTQLARYFPASVFRLQFQLQFTTFRVSIVS
jgi:hypothetical protein